MENVSERIQKLTEALYRVTELFTDKEPLKWQLRINAVELFDFLITKEKEELFDARQAFELTERISRLLKLAYEASFFVSNINFEILRREYISLSDSLKLQIEDKKIIFSLNPASNGQSTIDNDFHNGQFNNHNGHKGQKDAQTETEIKMEKELTSIQEKQEIKSPVENMTSMVSNNKQAIVLKERKRKILSLLGENVWVSISEICGSLPEIGAKSVQRDLLEMVQAGILKKEGDKRWRKYSLAG